MIRVHSILLNAALAIAALATPKIAAAGTETFAGATFGPGRHPRSHTLWVRAPEVERWMVISVSYERNYGPPTQGEVSGRCAVVGRRSFAIGPIPIEEYQAGRYYWVIRGFAEGELVSCELDFKRMPAVPEDGWAKVRVGVAERTTDHASPWVQILAVTPQAGRRLLNGDLIQVDVRATNPTMKTLQLHVGLVDKRTGFSPGYSTTDSPALLAPGETARFLRTYITGCGSNDPDETEWVKVGLYDPGRSVLFTVFDGAEIKTTKRHPFSHRCFLQTSPARSAPRLTASGFSLTLP